MQRLGCWLQGVTDHLTRHWKQHLLPFGLVFLGMVLFGWTMIMFWVLIFGGTFALIGLGYEEAAMICFFGVAALGSLTMFTFQLVGAVFFVGYGRLALRLQQGHATTWKELLWGFRHPFRSVGLIFVVLLMVFASASLFYLPLIFLGGWIMLALPSVVDGDRGLIGGLGRAWVLTGRAYVELMILAVVTGLAGLVMGGFPMVGPVAVPVLGIIIGAVTYDLMMRE